ncbi:MAG: aKG-HExxH-type peptide beta-hydroxylase [Algoriphagus sp.]
MLHAYANWLGISRLGLRAHLIQKLDEFVFALVVLSQIAPKESITLKVKKNAIIPLTSEMWRLLENVDLKLSPTTTVTSEKNLEMMRVSVNSLGIETQAEFSQLPSSKKFPLHIDLYSEASRSSFPGREQLPRVSEQEQEVLLKQIQVIEKALDYIGLVDSSITQYFKEVPNYFVPLIGPDGTLPSSSNSSVDTMFWYSATNQPLLMAEMIIHELSHQRVFRLQDKDPLIDPEVHGSGWDICEIYSPWRDDPRPVNGVFHGFVVFTEAAKFWMSLINQGGLHPEELDISKRRMTMLALQLDHAQKSLATCTYTELGKSVFDAYAQVLEGTILPYIKKHNLGDLKPFFMEFHDQEQPIGVSIAEVVEGHKSQWITRNGRRN